MPIIGETIFASFGRFGKIDVRSGTVVNVSPTGTIKADFGRKNVTTGKPFYHSFKSDGWERGRFSYESAHLISAAEYEMLSAQQDRQTRCNNINSLIRRLSETPIIPSNYDTLTDLANRIVHAVESLADQA